MGISLLYKAISIDDRSIWKNMNKKMKTKDKRVIFIYLLLSTIKLPIRRIATAIKAVLDPTAAVKKVKEETEIKPIQDLNIFWR